MSPKHLLKPCSKCGTEFSIQRMDNYCAPCRRNVYLGNPKYQAQKVTEFKRRFPGVDIDAIHYKLGKVKKREAA